MTCHCDLMWVLPQANGNECDSDRSMRLQPSLYDDALTASASAANGWSPASCETEIIGACLGRESLGQRALLRSQDSASRSCRICTARACAATRLASSSARRALSAASSAASAARACVP